MHVAPVAAWNGATPTVPQGFRIEALATGLSHPRSVYALPNGDVLVVESSGPKAPVYRPKDLIMGWVQSLRRRQAEGGQPHHPAPRHQRRRQARRPDRVHRSSPLAVRRRAGRRRSLCRRYRRAAALPLRHRADQHHRARTKLTDLPGGPIDHHWTKSLVASRDGSKLYVGVGSNSNITENGIGAELDRAAVWEVDRATGASRLFATGIRNPTGLGWEPQSRALWAVANERDELGPNLVPDYLTSVKDGAFYGWPYSYYGQHIDPRVKPQRPDLVASAIPPDYALSSHVAPLGLAFSTGTSLPAAYSGGAFVGEHGSWDRDPLNGYKVVYRPVRGGRPNGPPQDVVTGFLDKTATRAAARSGSPSTAPAAC